MNTTLASIDQLLAGGGKTAKFETVGETHAGEIVSIDTRQVNDYETGTPEFWQDGRPKQQIVVTFDTGKQEGPDDDGHRNLYIKGWGDQLRAFRDAARRLGRNPQVGDRITATYVADGEKKNPRFNAPKLYQYDIEPGTPGLSAMLNDGAQTAPQAQQAAPAQAQAPASQPGAQQPTQQGDQSQKVKSMIMLGLTDEQIAEALGLDQSVVAYMREHIE
ncbi:hypothetical protein HMPREF1484_00224 [Dermabacter sp. HFH0086]|uniref:hypothetical protein n=1 Tax=Dermabacter TaxID=36739 RepID=UPI00035459D1|nr:MULTISPECIES: hypothetical protein [Dermabacter]EPH17539.1 hypothetical protein HMPREF1484_00224 [Dermabacter sp. HFH0086]